MKTHSIYTVRPKLEARYMKALKENNKSISDFCMEVLCNDIGYTHADMIDLQIWSLDKSELINNIQGKDEQSKIDSIKLLCSYIIALKENSKNTSNDMIEFQSNIDTFTESLLLPTISANAMMELYYCDYKKVITWLNDVSIYQDI
jgi:hypothetical protein